MANKNSKKSGQQKQRKSWNEKNSRQRHTIGLTDFFGPWTLDLGPCSGMNDHPGKDTDVISRPSESTIKDLSFYIGFTRIQSSIKHLGPCFGTNGHSRRDPDVISRLSDTTTQDQSVFVGFRCSNRVKMVVFDENIGYIRTVMENLICS